jgi:DNA mismatch repair ATPase MutS
VIESRLAAIEELLVKPEILSGLQSTLNRFGDIDQLLSLCAVVTKEQVKRFKNLIYQWSTYTIRQMRVCRTAWHTKNRINPIFFVLYDIKKCHTTQNS